MQQFRLKGSDVIKDAAPGSVRHGVLSRSQRYELIGDAPEPPKPPELADLTIKQLLQRAEEEGVTLDPKWRKARMVEVLRDAGVSPVALVDVAEAAHDAPSAEETEE